MSKSYSHYRKLTRGHTIAIISAAFLSTTAIFIRYLTQTYHIPTMVLSFWRDGFVVITLLLVMGLLSHHLLLVRRQYIFYLVLYGLVIAIFNSLWTFSVAMNGAAVSTVLVYCSAGFTALLGWWLLKERLDLAKLLAVAFSLGGCVLVSGAFNVSAWRANWIGILTGVLSGLLYAIYSLMGRSASRRSLNPWTTLFYSFGFATLFLLLFNLHPGGYLPGTAARLKDFFWLGDSIVGWGILFLLAAGPTVAGFGLYNVSLTYLPSSVVNLIVTLEPVFTTITAYLLFGERLSGVQLTGGLMILAGVIFLIKQEERSAIRIKPETASRQQIYIDR